MKKILFPLLCFFLFLSCTPIRHERETITYDTYALYDSYSDSQGNEGIVFLKEQKDTGEQWVVVLSADETESSWGPEDKYVYPMARYANAIWADTRYPKEYPYAIDINQQVEQLGVSAYPAFAWCQAKNKEGERIHAGSWILPSQWMMAKALNANSELVNEALARHHQTPLSSTGYYWTCTEDIDDYLSDSTNDRFTYGYDPVSRAIPINCEAGYPIKKTVWQKENTHRVRAVKIIFYHAPIFPKKVED